MNAPSLNRPSTSNRNKTLGRGLIATAVVSTAVIQPLADLNNSHGFNEDWPPHARRSTCCARGAAIDVSTRPSRRSFRPDSLSGGEGDRKRFQHSLGLLEGGVVRRFLDDVQRPSEAGACLLGDSQRM